MSRCWWICVFWAGLASAQTGGSASSPPPQDLHPPQAGSTAAPTKIYAELQAAADRVPMDEPVITITGLCKQPADQAAAADCKTVITKAQFQKLADVLDPHSSFPGRAFLAHSYVQNMIKGYKAEEMGLDKQPDFEDRIEILQLMVTGKSLYGQLKRQEWDKISSEEVDDYYHKHPQEFLALDVDRIFVPYFAPSEDSQLKLTEAEKPKRDAEWREKLRQEAEKLRARAIKGESFYVLQEEANRFTDLANGPVTALDITLNGLRLSMLGDGEIRQVVGIGPGDFSPVYSEDNGYYVFKVTKKVTIPLEKARDEIHNKLRNEAFDRDKSELDQLAARSADYDERYFGPPPPSTNPSH